MALGISVRTLSRMMQDAEFPADDVRTPGTNRASNRFDIIEVRKYLNDRNMAPLRTDYLIGKVKRDK